MKDKYICDHDPCVCDLTGMYHIKPLAGEDWQDFRAIIQIMLRDNVLIPVKPCKHGKLDGHWPNGICRCFVDALDPDKGRGHWRDTGEEYVPDKWVLCTHEPFCPGVT